MDLPSYWGPQDRSGLFADRELPIHLNEALKEGPTKDGCLADLKGNDNDKWDLLVDHGEG